MFSGPNMNTNFIWVHKFDRIRIRILFFYIHFLLSSVEFLVTVAGDILKSISAITTDSVAQRTFEFSELCVGV